MTLIEIFFILIVHWIADFICQDEKWANNKSTSIIDLITHTFIYTYIFYLCFLCFGIVSSIMYGYTAKDFGHTLYIFLFFPITFILHTLTDYFTSKIVKYKFNKKHYGSSIPNFGAFTIIGLDQLLHYIQLFLTYYLLKQIN